MDAEEIRKALEAEQAAFAEAAARALKEAQEVLDQGGVSIPPGAWGH